MADYDIVSFLLVELAALDCDDEDGVAAGRVLVHVRRSNRPKNIILFLFKFISQLIHLIFSISECLSWILIEIA